MNEAPKNNLEIESPLVNMSQDSGRMLLSVSLPEIVMLTGVVSYPYLSPEERMRDHQNGQAQIENIRVNNLQNDEKGMRELKRLITSFLQNVSPLSAKTLHFPLRSRYPEWLIRTCLNIFGELGLQVDKVKSLKSQRLISREMFESEMAKHLPAVIIADLSTAFRARLQHVLATL